MTARKNPDADTQSLEEPPIDNIDISVVAQENEEAEREEALKHAPARTRNSKPKGTALNELNDSHLRQEDGSPFPIHVVTEHLQATVVSDLGRPLLKVALLGWVGEESVIVPVSQAGELRELADLLDAEAAKR